jgi:phosphatidylserine/phosphatidylglycerophosphate/cardiolipin synthase-like enzyme
LHGVRRPLRYGSLLFAVIAFTGGYLAGLHGAPTQAQGAAPNGVTGRPAACYFSPNGGCRDAIVDQINGAQTSIEVQAFTLTSPTIGDAILKAYRRGVQVAIVLDAAKTGESREVAAQLALAGVPVYVDMAHGVADSRLVLIDNQVVATGSFNLSEAGESENSEDLIVLRDNAQVQAACENHFQQHLQHAIKFDGK